MKLNFQLADHQTHHIKKIFEVRLFLVAYTVICAGEDPNSQWIPIVFNNPFFSIPWIAPCQEGDGLFRSLDLLLPKFFICGQEGK